MKNEYLNQACQLSERGQLILCAAQTLFLTQGYDETSLEMIIKQSGGSRRNIYNEFGNKQGLLIAMLNHHIAIQANMIAAIDYSLPTPDALKALLFPFVESLLSDTLMSFFRLVSHVSIKIPEIGQLVYDKGPLTGLAPLNDYFEHLNKGSQFYFSEPQFSSQTLVEMSKAHLHLKRVLIPHQQISKDEIRDHINKTVDLFLKAYRIN